MKDTETRRRGDTETFLSEEIREIYRRVAAREPGREHGDFLTTFAEAVIRADEENFEVLRPAARILMQRYWLVTEFAAAGPPPPDKPFPEEKPGERKINGAQRIPPASDGDLFGGGPLPPK